MRHKGYTMDKFFEFISDLSWAVIILLAVVALLILTPGNPQQF